MTDRELLKLTTKMRQMLEVQGRSGNWDFDPYMHGMYNGMESMLSLVENREPAYREAPSEWKQHPLQRKPLTDDEIWEIVQPHWDCFRNARAIERAHGIGDKE